MSEQSAARSGSGRPGRPATADGRPLREVLTYSRRGGRLNERQQDAWESHRERWWISEESATAPGFGWPAVFGRDAPLLVEIGSGTGEATVALAASRPAYDVIALEVWRPGVADTLDRIATAGLSNVRVLSLDGVWALEHLLAPDSVAELWTFFPDPWPKKRHHKRRLVAPAFAALAASRLAPPATGGGTWRLATDWRAYADQMRAVLDAEPLLAGGVVPRWPERPVTRFERRGLADGRLTTDLAYVRR